MVKYLRMESYGSFINILQGYFTGIEADVVLIVYTVVGMHSTWYCA